MKNLLFKLHLQLFAEPGEGGTGTATNGQGADSGNVSIDYARIE